MLIQFCFKNFKSFRDDTILDLSATKITEHSERVVSAGSEKLLPAAAVFGANASGKSNVIEAFRYMSEYVVSSFSYGGEMDNKKSKGNKLKYTPFLFDAESKDSESSFEIYFIDSEEHDYKTYNYGFTLNRDGICEEWLNTKAKTSNSYRTIFYRNGDDLDLSGLSRKSQELVRISLNKESLIVSLGAKLKILKLKVVRDWFLNCNFADFGNPYENVFLSSVIPDRFYEDKSIQDNVVKYFASFDPSIIGFNVEILDDENKDFMQLKIDAVHRMVNGETATIPLDQESKGTLKMLALYSPLYDTLESGGVLCVDELNARLHPLLVRNFLITFLNPETNPNHAQIVFTAHDSWLLSSGLLRRDELWFTEKDDKGTSKLYSLADFVDEDGTKIRKDANYGKNYLLGKYGAIPKLRCIDVFKGE